MGVYLHNMEMPKGTNMMLLISPDGDVWEMGDLLGDDKHLDGVKAVPVPPHGRLGDLDALAGYIHQQEDWLSEAAIHAFCGILCKMPTIIPPSGGKENE